MSVIKNLEQRMGPLGQFYQVAHHKYMYPILEGELAPRMNFNGKEHVVWSLNNYLGLGNHPEVRLADNQGTQDYGLAYPMGSRMMSGNSQNHEKLETDLAHHVGKESGFLLNFGYQGMLSIITTVLSKKDVVLYDAHCHACILDGIMIHLGKKFSFKHNDMGHLEQRLKVASGIVEKTGGQIWVISEGVFGMSGNLGDLQGIAKLKKQYDFGLLLDDAHGFGIFGENGEGTHSHLGVPEAVDIYFSTFAKSMAGIGAFVASESDVITFLKYNMRSQIYAKSLPMPMVIGGMKRLELLKKGSDLRKQLWDVTNYLQASLRKAGLDIGTTQSPLTPVRLEGSIEEAIALTEDLRQHYGVFCSLVVYPVIPKGIIILRVIPTAMHTREDADVTVDALSKVAQRLRNKEYLV